MFADPTKKFDSAFLSNYYYYTKKLVCLWNGRLNCWSLYIMTGFSWSLCIMTGFSWSLYIMTEMTAVRIYNDWFRIWTITDTYFCMWAFERNVKLFSIQLTEWKNYQIKKTTTYNLIRGGNEVSFLHSVPPLVLQCNALY